MANEMTTEQARSIFDQAAREAPDADTRASRELLREYFTNPEFRRAMHDYVWNINSGKA